MKPLLLGKINFRTKSIYILSALMSFLLVLGHSYNEKGSWALLFGGGRDTLISALVFAALFILFSLCIGLLFSFLDNFRLPTAQKEEGRFRALFERRPVLVSMIILIVCWLPYIIAFYPAILSPDPSFQIMQFFGIETKYSDYVIMINENVLITNHHPVLHTLLLGGLTKLGDILGSVNLGLFFYSIVQITVLSSTLAYSVRYLGKIGMPYTFRLVVLFIFALLPIFPFYAMSPVKDVLFSAFILLYLIFIHSLLTGRTKLNVYRVISLTAIMLLIQLLRHNGFFLIIMTIPLVFAVGREYRKKLTLVFVCAVGLYMGYNKILLPLLEITPGSVREMLSVPFQQTARYVSEHSDELTDSDIEIIDNILGYEDLADRYNPALADPVKNGYNKYATNEDLLAYFGVWFDGLLKHPTTYMQATIHNIYGYLCPNKTSWYIYHSYDDRLEKRGIEYSYNEDFEMMRLVVSLCALALPYIPVAGLSVNIGFYVWLLIIMAGYLIHRKKARDITYLLPYIAVVLVCFISPANTYFRYVLPLMMHMPFIVGLFLHSLSAHNGAADTRIIGT